MRLLKRDFSKLGSVEYDLLVIGGGIAGLSIAWDAALRGLSVALVEKEDFGAGSSQGCFKIVHGGLRYLQHADLRRLWESVEEQRVLRVIAPHLVTPLPILVPCYGWGMKSPEVLRAGIGLYDLITGNRNRGVSPSARLPRGRFLTKEQCLEEAPHLQSKGLRGGAVFYDAQMSNCDRLTLAFGLSAAERGAVICNYAEVVNFRTDANKIQSVEVKDNLGAQSVQVRARAVVNSTGVWNSTVRSLLDRKPARPRVFSKGMQVVLPRTVLHYAVALESRYADKTAYVARGGRSYFIVPWRGATLVGTADIVHEDEPDACSFTESEVKKFIAEVRAMYSAPQIDYQYARFVFGGLRPVAPDIQERFERGEKITDDEVGAAKKDIVGADGVEVCNFLNVIGVKYTTCRAVAQTAVDKVCAMLGVSAECKTKSELLVGAEIEDAAQYQKKLLNLYSDHYQPALLKQLASNYGARAERVLELSEVIPQGSRILSPSSHVLAAEVVYAIRDEMAVSLADIVFRRTPLGTAGSPGRAALESVAELAAAELGWDEQEKRRQLSGVLSRFPGNC